MRCDDGMVRNDRDMMIGGVVLSGLGGLSLIGGLVTLMVGTFWVECGGLFECHNVENTTLQTAGAGLMIAGVALAGVGIPLAVVGAKKVPREGGPQVQVGAGRVALDWSF
jgi:hypothetical protein